MKKPFTPHAPAPALQPACPKQIAMAMATAGSESLQVFCRLCPTEDASSMRVISDTTLRLTLPESSVNFRPGACKEYQYSFKRVFTDSQNQKEVFDCVALPLVENVIKGKNGLLFTYGVTGSGKTYTMTGIEDSVGILPRCLDVIFNSVSEYQAKRFVFKPDKMNGFEIQSEDDALKEFNNFSRYGKLKKKESNENLTNTRSKDGTKIPVPDEDNAFAVFVTYIEIYNNNVYDLLENYYESDVYIKLQSKIVREDAAHNMYVHGVTEIEVKTAEEAYEVFRKGQKRKRMGHTCLNTESSRSHSIFTIRLVQAPLDIYGESVLKDKKTISISQLSLVDLAGSERTNRTNNSGQRLREAGNINNSLMTLRNCLEILRENQQTTTGGSKIIPHRESRLTHLFKNFFDGEGDIHMVVCVNPRLDDYDETIQVMKFAEVSQEILVKPTPARTELPIGLTPGRRRVNQAMKKLQMNPEEGKENEATEVAFFIPTDAEIIYILQPFPALENVDPADADVNKNLMKFLEERIEKKRTLMADLNVRAEKFRAAMLSRKDNYTKIEQDLNAVNARRHLEQSRMKTLEDKVISLNSNLSNVRKERDDYMDENKRLKRDLENKENIIQHFSVEKDREKRVNQKIAAKVDKLAKEKEYSLKEKQQIEFQLKDKEKQLRRVKKALTTPNENSLRVKIARLDDCSTETETETETASSKTKSGVKYPQTPVATMSDRQGLMLPFKSTTIAVSNPRFGKTHCDGHDQWLDHRAAISAPLNTIMQPVMKRRRSFSTITSPKEVTKTSKYCLMTQNRDDDGTVETQLYKGDVVPTYGGGAQVIFNGVETLKQTSPVMSPVTSPRKVTTSVTSPSEMKHQLFNSAIAVSSGSSLYPDIPDRCAISLEGHSRKKH